VNLKTGALIAVVALVGIRGACVLITDAATRLAEDLMVNAALLRWGSGSDRVFVHNPRFWPSGCEGDYAIELQESLHHPESGGSLLVGCKGSPSFLKLGYSYNTTSHLNAVQVPKQLLVDKEAGETFRVTLRKRNGAVEIARLE
jgi:hypothetical protein